MTRRARPSDPAAGRTSEFLLQTFKNDVADLANRANEILQASAFENRYTLHPRRLG